MVPAQATFRTVTLSAICVWLVSQHVMLGAAQGTALSEQAIQDAIRLGSQGTPTPYQLIWRTGEKEAGTTVVGAVYTPFVRVAMWVHGRQKDALEFPAVTDIPPELLSPTLMIALRQEPSCCPAVEPGPPMRVYAVLVPAPSRHMLLCMEAPSNPEVVLRASTDLSSLRLFDRERASRSSAIVTIPFDRIRSGWDIVYEMHRREAGGTEALHFIGFGMIRDSDIASWR